jgi:hypothetical protein
MTQRTHASTPLLPEWAFVVQFRGETNVAQRQLEGRVVHIVSGEALQFHSLEELLDFWHCILEAVRVQSPAT